MESNNDKKPHVLIGSIGHVGHDRKKLNDAISKALKDGNEKQETNKEKKSLKRKGNTINDEVIEIEYISPLDL